jgi:hypothetical protein
MMEDAALADVFDLIERPQTTEEATHAFRADLDRLGLSQRALAAKMRALGDARSFDTLLRSVQRMATGEARVSGEMQVIMTMLLRERTRAQRMLDRTVWTEGEGGGLVATVEGAALSLSPQSRGRWQVHAQIDEKRGYSPPIPHWRNSLEEAKLRAMMCVDETLDQAQPA